MMRSRLVALFAACAVGAVVAGLRWREAAAPEFPSPRLQLSRAAPLPPPKDDVLDDAEDATVSNDPFRLANEPAAVRFDPSHDAAVASIPSVPPPRPALSLKAIIGGPPWQAVIDGIPGQPPGTIVSPGARFEKLLVRSVSRDSVVVQGEDTTWVLSFAGRS